MSQPTTTAPAPIMQFRVLAATLMGALVVFLLVLGFALGFDGYPPTWAPWALGALAVAAHLAASTVGYRVPAVAPGTPPEAARSAAIAAYQQSMVLRFAVCEAVAITALVLAFALTPQTAMTYLVGAVLSLLLMLWHVWPSRRLVAKVEALLDRDGGRSGLQDALFGTRSGDALLS
jgi:hypothetical protein